jgi:hypothetical protein
MYYRHDECNKALEMDPAHNAMYNYRKQFSNLFLFLNVSSEED